jgi:hypothetical protein
VIGHGTSREEEDFTMETTMAATPKARLAIAAAPESSPVTARMTPPFACPPLHVVAEGPSANFRPTRRTTVRVPRKSEGVGSSLASLASIIESAPMPSLPDGVWTIIGRAWFFLAGTTMGIMLALALIAGSGAKRATPRATHAVVSATSARVLVIQRPTSASERGIGELAENDVVEEAPVAAPPVARRPAVVARRAPATNRGPSSKDLLSAGL